MHRWLVFISACGVMIVEVGFAFSVGVLFVDFMNVFNVSRSKAALVQSVLLACSLSSGLFVGPLMQKFGALKTGLFGAILASTGLVISFFATSISYLVISIGVVTAVGTVCLFIVSNAAVGQHFVGKKALVLLSIVNACSGLGGMVFPFILAYLSETFGLRGTLLLCSGIIMNTIPAVLLWSSPRQIQSKTQRMNNIPDHVTDASVNDFDRVNGGFRGQITPELGETITIESLPKGEHLKTGLLKSAKLLFSNKCFILYATGMAFAYPPIMMLLTFIVDTFIDSGLSKSDANFGLLLMNAFSIFGRLLPGFLMQSKHVGALMIPTFASIVACVSLLGLILVRALSLKLVFLSIVGIPFGIFVTSFTVTTLDIVGPTQLGNAVGIAFTANGLASIGAGPLSGYIRDVTGSYLYVFLVGSGLQVISTSLFLSAMFFRKRTHQPVFRKASVFYLTKI